MVQLTAAGPLLERPIRVATRDLCRSVVFSVCSDLVRMVRALGRMFGPAWPCPRVDQRAVSQGVALVNVGQALRFYADVPKPLRKTATPALIWPPTAPALAQTDPQIFVAEQDQPVSGSSWVQWPILGPWSQQWLRTAGETKTGKALVWLQNLGIKTCAILNVGQILTRLGDKMRNATRGQ